MIAMSSHLLGRLAGAVVDQFVAYAGRYAYRGQHRAAGASTSRLAMESASYLASLVVPAELVPLDEVLEVAPARAALGRYAHLRTDELDSTAERLWLLNELGVAPPRTAWIDEWAADELVGAAT